MTIASARQNGLDTFMFTTTAARAEFAAQHGGTEFTETFTGIDGREIHLYCLAVAPRTSAGHKFIRASEA